MAVDLIPHPQTPPRAVKSVRARWYFAHGGRFLLRWLVDGVEALEVPEFAGRSRADGLWEATCFELFLQDQASERYAEFNFSPSGRWAAWLFERYREGRTDLDMDDGPEIATGSGQFLYALTATMDASLLEGVAMTGISAVIVEKDGTKSYWAAAHSGGKPDFHDRACFTVPVPAPRRR